MGNHQKNSINLRYEVIKGGDLDIGIMITNDKKQKLMHKLSNFDVRRGGQNEAEKVNLVHLQDGIYEICFDNIMASRDFKVIVLSLDEPYKQTYTPSEHREKLAEKSELDNLSESAVKLQRELEKLETLQQYTQTRMNRHLWTQEST